MKKALLVALALIMVFSMLTACRPGPQTRLKVGMVTDAGTIDDKSFNEGTWTGVVKAATELNLEYRYLKPVGTTPADYIKEIINLYDAGFRLIVTPGFKFETTIYDAQARYPDCKFVLLDGFPHSGDWNPVVADNTVAIFFAEHESGFMAGVATALQLKTGSVGFLGGMEIPPVQKFNWGFQQGIAYANTHFGTNVVIAAQNVVYQGTFDDVAAGQAIAAQMFDRRVRAIFCAAGGVGIGAINEAKARKATGKEAWIIGVDVDQFYDGIFAENQSVILTSAMKRIDIAAYDMIKAAYRGEFPGGQTLVFDARNNGIGLPETNPNLDQDVQDKLNVIFTDLQEGRITVSDVRGDLIR